MNQIHAGGIRQPSLLLGVGIALLVGAIDSYAADVSQIKVGSLTATAAPSTTQANAYYSASTVSTREIWGPDPAANRPAEFKELARALHNNVDLIYEYVHDNIRTTFMYGLQKGALGALIDQSGTPFDQAELMVELLRESGYSARYKVGTLLLSTAQANSWIGTSDTTALQQIFRDGGFPLDYSGGNFTIGHVWVEVTIAGSSCNATCWFDPSYKTYTFKPTLANLPALMGITNPATEFDTTTSGNFFMQSWVGLQKQTTAADPVWISNVNNTNIVAKLEGTAPAPGFARTLLANLKTAPYNTYEIDDIVGGQQINKTGSMPVRNSGGFPGVSAAAQRTWDCTDNAHCGVPDAYRTLLTVTMIDLHVGNPVVINKPLFADEIYGRRLYVDVPLNVYAPDTGGPGSWEHFCIKLTLDGTPLTDTASNHTVVGCTGAEPPEHNPLQRKYRIRLEVDHPYAGPIVSGAGTGTYMDLTAAGGTATERDASLLSPVIIVDGFGDVSPALVSKLASEQHDDRLFPVVDPYPGDGQPYEPGDRKGDSSMDHTMTKLGASYLAQYSQMAELQKRLGNAEHAMHHQIGLVYTIDDPENGWSASGNPDPPNTDNEWAIRDRAIRINVDGAISVNSKSNTDADRRKVIHATLAAAAALEGSLFEQMLDNWATASTANRFQWGNQNISGMKFYLYRPTSPAPPGGFGSDATSVGCTPPGYAGLTFGGPNALPDYVNGTKGFWAIVAADQCIGPGNRYGMADEHTGFGVAVPSLDRGRAFVAFQPDNSSVAHVVTSTTTAGIDGTISKGGGAAVAPAYNTEFDATGVASLLKDKFDDKSRLNGIDLNTGELTYSAPADLTVGEGGFPYELSFQRSFKASASKSPGLPEGWAHNLDVRLSYSGDGLAKMGRDSAQAAAETIAAFYVAQQIYSFAPTLDANTSATNLQSHLKRWALAPFVMQWWGSKLNYSVVTINAGHDARQFTKMADGLFAPPRNGVGTLAQTGARALHTNFALTSQWGETAYDHWDYSGLSFSFTSPEKDVQTFAFYGGSGGYDIHGSSTEHASGAEHGWRLSTWVFPYGVTVNYTYASSLVVSNNLGRSLTLTYTVSPDLDGDLLTSVSDGQGRTVTFSQPATFWQDRVLASVTSPENGNGAELTKYQYIGDIKFSGGTHNDNSIPAGARPQVYTKLWQVFAPSDGTSPKMQIDYDRTWRAKTYADAVAIKTPANRNPYSYYVTGTSRGERADPLGNLYSVYYDDRARALQFIDEENRAVNQTFDNHDRVAQRTYPEGNSVQFAYDDVTQQVKTLI
ncbi:MAG TPA: transglutaminase domain-containing protein [Steroidobacteraceae bacterium]|nr:transglutaminase domain-containing protein [Steroidobacteraceae bacterium]